MIPVLHIRLSASDHFAMAYYHVWVAGSAQLLKQLRIPFPEKLIPLMINNIRNNKPLPVW
jgi:dTDP-glucose 4,6-dehydratase